MEKSQSATFTVSADTPEELARMLRRIADALDDKASGATTGPVSGWVLGPDGEMSRTPEQYSPSEILDWYRLKGSTFLSRLTKDALDATVFVARHAPRVPVSALAGEVDRTPGPSLAGSLSSIGHVVRWMHAPGSPFRRVRSNYEMDPRMAKLILSLYEESLRERESPVDEDSRDTSASR